MASQAWYDGHQEDASGLLQQFEYKPQPHMKLDSTPLCKSKLCMDLFYKGLPHMFHLHLIRTIVCKLNASGVRKTYLSKINYYVMQEASATQLLELTKYFLISEYLLRRQ